MHDVQGYPIARGLATGGEADPLQPINGNRRSTNDIRTLASARMGQ
ncbi:hypothetical protein AAG612_06465 [Citromicrobium bathyomarinum]